MPPASRPVLIAHRGAAADAPENTIAAFELALEQGADGLDLDVHLSADEHPVVIHDFTLERTTDGSGAVSALRVRELKRLDAGGWRDRRFEGQRGQTLQEVFERFRDRARFWLAEGRRRALSGPEARGLDQNHHVVDRVLVQSFDPIALATVRSLNPEIRVGTLVAQDPLDPALLGPDAPDAICPAIGMCTEKLVGAIRRAGRDCYV
jgi:glycerophosphoryl diester phosphodiesterase